MTTSPKIVERAAQPYVAIKSLVSWEEIGPVTGKLFGEVFGWLGRHWLAPAGAPFFSYGAVDMEQGLEKRKGEWAKRRRRSGRLRHVRGRPAAP